MESLLEINGHIVKHEGREFESPKRWVICFLSSLRNVRHFNGTSYDPFVSIIFVVITDEQIENGQIEACKELVSATHEGALIVVRKKIN